jgi:hypothetical protein
MGKLLQRPQHTVITIRNLQQPRLIHLRRHYPSITHHGSDRSIRQRRLHIIMPIQPFATNCKEQLPGANRPRVDPIPHRFHQRIELTIRMNPIRNLSQRQLH